MDLRRPRQRAERRARACLGDRYAAGVREILEHHLDGKALREEYQIVTDGAWLRERTAEPN